MDIFQNIANGKYENKIKYSKETAGEYHKESGKMYKLFMDDLAEDLDIVNNPKKELLLSKAWAHGHSSGYSDVACVAHDLVDLIR